MSLAPPWSGKLSEGQFPAHLAGTGATQVSVQSKVGTGPGGHTHTEHPESRGSLMEEQVAHLLTT